MYITSGTIDSEELMTTIEYNPLNSINDNDLDKKVLDDYVLVSSSSSTEIIESDTSSEKDLDDDDDDDDDYFAQFSWPDDTDDDLDYFYNDDNDDLFLNNHLNSKQSNLTKKFEEKNYQRSKRSNKKIHAQRQIKTKYAQSIKNNSHNKHLYIHHRVAKQIQLDPPSRNDIPSPPPAPLYSTEALKSIIYEHRHLRPVINITRRNPLPPPPPPPSHTNNQFRDYIINEQTMQNQSSFDDAMIAFLLDMQNRDLSPEDYEMLLRLDEHTQRKTIDKNLLNSLPTITVNETHLNDQCTICMENYLLGQELKLLPCKHLFHLNCIDTYLKEFSIQCPLDNLPLI